MPEPRGRRSLRGFIAARGLNVIHWPLRDFSAGNGAPIQPCIHRVLAELRDGRHVAIHCRAGRERAGMFAACLAREALGLSGDEALAWIRELGPGAVETRGQEDSCEATPGLTRGQSLSGPDGVLLMIVVLALATIANRLLIPYPIFLVVGGLALSFVPQAPVIPLEPDLVFLTFLPPILWAAAYFTSLRDFRANLRPITLLAVGLVAATTVAVAVVARAIIPGLSWAAAFVLGAIVSPPMPWP